MKVNFDTLDLSSFNLSSRKTDSFGELFLITPRFNKHSWTPSEIYYRSLLCRPNGEVVSAGPEKFKNWGEDSALDRLTAAHISNGNCWLSEKVDGSLIIRSVIDDKVHLRTRGCHQLADDFREPIESLIIQKYPKIMDPGFDRENSLLFEYTSPDNQIVLSYSKPSLTSLGKVSLKSDPIHFFSSPEVVLGMEELYGTPAVSFHQMGQKPDNVLKEVKGWMNSEGVVVWCPLPSGRMHLAKIKADEYIRIHSLKFQFSGRKLEAFCLFKGIEDLESLKKEIYRLGVDWEALSSLELDFNNYISKRTKVKKIFAKLIEQINEQQIERLASRKEKAEAIKIITNNNKNLFSVGIQYVTGNKNLQPAIDAMSLGVSQKRLQHIKSSAEELIKKIDAKTKD